MFYKKVLLVFASLVFFLMFLKIMVNRNIEPSYTNLPPVSEEFTTEELKLVRNDFLKIVNEKDPGVALAQMRERIKTDDALSRACHDLVHIIGHEAYKKYGDLGEALKFRDELCNSGYIHGVIESYLLESKDVFTSMKTMCNAYKLGSFISWECYHGAGHGVMYYTNNNLPRALQMCSQYSASFARSSCINGVFMENFNTDGDEHHSYFLKTDNLFYPCNEEDSKYKSDCYLYAPIHYLNYHKNDYLGALEWCKNAEQDYVSICIQGVGSQAIKENIHNPKNVEEICNRASDATSCIAGMVGLYINHYGALDPAKNLCDELQPSNQKVCLDTVSLTAPLFE